MDYNPEVFSEQFPIVNSFVYHLIYYRELIAAYHRLQLESEFWTHTINAHLLQATICWCMVFGSHGCNPTHWKSLSIQESEELQLSFRKGLLEQTGLSMKQWRQYWNKMIGFHNQYVAHRELSVTKPIPDFTIALKVTYYYDHWIREVISPDILEEPPLEKSAEALRQSVAPLISQLLVHTRKYEEHAEPSASADSDAASPNRCG